MFVGSAAVDFRRAAAGRDADHGAGAPTAAAALDADAARDRQHSPAGALTPSVVLSLGLGLSLLVTVVEIDGNLHRQFAAALPENAPSFFFLDIPSADAERFDAFVHATGAGLDARARADAARPHRRRQRHQGRGSQARRRIGLGAARRPRHHLCAGAAGRLAPGRRRMVGRRLFRPAARFA